MNNNVLSFKNVTYEETLNEINNLNTLKSTQSVGIPIKIIKDDTDIFANFILQNCNQNIREGKCPNQSKKQVIVLSLKKKSL